MSLTISLRVPDGIVLAADSLLTIQTQSPPKEEFVRCPKCEGRIPYARIAPPPPVPVSISPYGQKLFCIRDDVGIASFGIGFLTGRTIQNHIKEFERTQIYGEESIEEIANKIEEYFRKELTKEVGDLKNIPDNEYPIGLQVSGYDEDDVKIGKTFLVKIGKQSDIEPVHSKGYGCTFGGDGKVIQKLWKEDPNIPIAMPNFHLLTLQDAIDYAIFLMQTTIQFQRFAAMIPTCGGDIDIAIITYPEGFVWIERKELVGIVK
jgi:20S proteasome alpha/beta subunit